MRCRWVDGDSGRRRAIVALVCRHGWSSLVQVHWRTRAETQLMLRYVSMGIAAWFDSWKKLVENIEISSRGRCLYSHHYNTPSTTMQLCLLCEEAETIQNSNSFFAGNIPGQMASLSKLSKRTGAKK